MMTTRTALAAILLAAHFLAASAAPAAVISTSRATRSPAQAEPEEQPRHANLMCLKPGGAGYYFDTRTGRGWFVIFASPENPAGDVRDGQEFRAWETRAAAWEAKAGKPDTEFKFYGKLSNMGNWWLHQIETKPAAGAAKDPRRPVTVSSTAGLGGQPRKAYFNKVLCERLAD